jgi:hypothetical protein
MNVLGEPRLLDGARCDDPKLSGYLEVITQVPPLHVTSTVFREPLVLHHVRSGLRITEADRCVRALACLSAVQ